MSEDIRTFAASERDIVTDLDIKFDDKRSLNSQLVPDPDIKFDDKRSLNSQLVPVPDQDVAHNSSEINICQAFSQSLSLDAKAHKGLSKCKTFPVPKEVQEFSSSTNGKSGQDRESSLSGCFGYQRSISLPSSSALVSAMKGGRAMEKGELRVKWAPEVYDPPSTSMSHTVKSHQQRPKSKKKDKYKHKGKSSRGSGSERKHGSRKTFNKTPEPINVRFQGNSDRLVLDCFGKSKAVDVLEYGISGQEGKCGSSFLKEALPKVQLPFGEAS